MRQKRSRRATILRLMMVAAFILTVLPVELAGNAVPQALAANTKIITLNVLSARDEPLFPGNGQPPTGVKKGDPVAHYKWMINEDNVGNPLQARTNGCSPTNADGSPNSAYPDSCNWPSIRQNDAYSSIVAQGDETTLNSTTPLDLSKLKNGNYLISVQGDSFKIDGAHFKLPMTATTTVASQSVGVVEVDEQPFPLPLATVKLQVFNDTNPVNGQYDVPGENGLAGFEGHLTDILGEVTNDWFGNPLCTTYVPQKDANGNIIYDPVTGDPKIAFDPVTGKPVIQTIGGHCFSDANGVVTIPNMGPNRYTASVVAPNGQQWVQTTTLEGNHDWDVWVQEGATGFDTEIIGPNGEPVPAIPFGFVQPTASATLNNAPTTGTATTTGGIKGQVWASKTYIPQIGGLPFNGQGGVGASGTKLDKPIPNPWIALNNLQGGDVPVYVGRGNKDGTFQINNVPDGDYALAYWDDPQDFLFEFLNVTVSNGQISDMGNLLMAGWWTEYSGRVCINYRGDGKCLPTDPGLPNQTVVLKGRANNTLERGIASVTTDSNGYYDLREAYPLTSWLVMEVYNDRFKTNGVTFQADNQPTETTVLGNGVDVSVFPVIGVSGRLDWAVSPYDTSVTPTHPAENGGIVGTVTYDTTRNELDAAYAVTEAYQPGIPGLKVNLYKPVPCNTDTLHSCDPSGTYEINTDGSYYKWSNKTGTPFVLNTYTSEAWQTPTNCVPRDVYGNPVVQQVTPTSASTDPRCIEAPFMGVQFQNGFSTVDGNYSFTTTKRNLTTGAALATEQPLPAGDYLVEVEIPNDKIFNKPVYQVTKEEDVNIFTGDHFVPQLAPFPCAGPMHTVHVTNPNFLAGGGSPFEGQQKPLCNEKLVALKAGRSSATNFNLFTDVPVPGRLWGLINDDLNLSTNPKEVMFGEKRGLANVPVGIYDYSNRLITTVYSDPNGFYNALLPSTGTYNCPLPAGPCPNVYRLVGNDPGQPNALDPYYNPQYRTISASFEVWPGLIMPADHAPVPIGSFVATPGSQVNAPAQCKLDATTPQIFAVNQPYSNAQLTLTIQGQGFGASKGTGSVTLTKQTGTGPVKTTLATSSWSDGTIKATVPAPSASFNGPMQLNVTNSSGQTTINGLTFHVLSNSGYNPTVYEVGPNKPYTTIQAAIDAASNNPRSLVVVYPGTAKIPTSNHGSSTFNANGAYFENLLINSPIKLQGVGPGGIRAANNSTVNGSVIDGIGFAGETYGDAWRTKASTLRWSGDQTLYEGAVVTILAQATGNKAFTANFNATIDGFTITGGDQMGTPNKNNSQPGGGIVVTQGGGIFANAYARYLQVTNNIIRSNGGAYGGAIRLGTPYRTDNNNQNVHIANNQILANGGTNLAGGIGIFNGSDNYEIDHNDICGNYSAEYGGGISHYGLSPNGKIHDNRIYFNTSYDEGGGVKVAGELPLVATDLSKGSGPVDVYNNIIQANMANDDGGGVRLLMTNNALINIHDNMIVNNVSTHEGGGIALDDAANASIYNNTIMKNITTATAATSNGLPAPAGISTVMNSAQLQAILPAGSPNFSNPRLFNNILWDNRAGKWDSVNLIESGIGLQGDPAAINYWDMGSADSSTITLTPSYSLYQSTTGVTDGGHNVVGSDPGVVSTYDLSVTVFPWRTNANFVGSTVVALDLPPSLMGNYHLATGSAATGKGTASAVFNGTTVTVAPKDIDGDPRPNTTGGYDIGADETK